VRFAGLGFLATAVLLGGCTMWATYPPIQGAAGIDDPKLSPIPDLMADAIWYAYDEDGQPAPLVFNLPEGTPAAVFDMVTARLPEGSYAMTSPDQRAYHVYEVRVRSFDAQVDVIDTEPGGSPALTTFSFQRALDGNTVTAVRHWRVRVDVPAPTYYDPEADLPAIVEPQEEVATVDGTVPVDQTAAISDADGNPQ
jgi:hypothetical protein